MSNTIFVVDIKPFDYHPLDTPVDEFIHEHELLEETEDNYVMIGVLYSQDSQDIVRFPRELYIGFNTREEALIHLDRAALDIMQDLEERTSKLQHFINAVDDELRKS